MPETPNQFSYRMTISAQPREDRRDADVLERGTEDPFWPHIVLVPLSVVAAIAVGAGIVFERPKYPAAVHHIAFWLVVAGVAIESLCTVMLFVTDERISQAQQDKIIALSARPWTKDQFDAIQALKGSAVKGVAVISEARCIECSFFANHIERALHEAGITLYEDFPRSQWALDSTGTGIMVWVPSGFDLVDDPLVKTLSAAGHYPGAGYIDNAIGWPFKPDVWVIMVGERFPMFSKFPFEPKGGAQWEHRQLRK
jgi:hypothetical protein